MPACRLEEVLLVQLHSAESGLFELGAPLSVPPRTVDVVSWGLKVREGREHETHPCAGLAGVESHAVRVDVDQASLDIVMSAVNQTMAVSQRNTLRPSWSVIQPSGMGSAFSR